VLLYQSYGAVVPKQQLLCGCSSWRAAVRVMLCLSGTQHWSTGPVLFLLPSSAAAAAGLSLETFPSS